MRIIEIIITAIALGTPIAEWMRLRIIGAIFLGCGFVTLLDLITK